MININFDTITTPTPEPYDPVHPNKQRENWYYVLNQIVGQISGTVDIDLPEAVNALSMSGETWDIGNLIKFKRDGRTLTLTVNP